MSFPDASILMPSDMSDATQGAAAVIDPTTGGVLSTVTSGAPADGIVPYGSSGDVLSSGIWAIAAEDPGAGNIGIGGITGLAIYRQDGTLISHVTSVMSGRGATSGGLVRGDRAHTFYIAVNDPALDHALVYSVSDAGVVGGTTWSIPKYNSNHDLESIAVARDGSVLYYTDFQRTPFVVHRWDLVNNVQLADIVTETNPSVAFFDAMHILDDGSLLIVVRNGSTLASPGEIRTYNTTTGALINTYAIGTAWTYSPPEIGLNAPDLTYFWEKDFASDGTTATLRKVKISDFSIAASYTLNTLQGTGQVPVSCPVLVFPVNGGAGGGGIGSITVTKDAGGDTTTPFTFTTTGLTPSSFTLTGGQSRTFTGLTPGSSYGVQETPLDGWDLASATVSAGSLGGITVTAGQTTTVAFTNTVCDIQPVKGACWGNDQIPPTLAANTTSQTQPPTGASWSGSFSPSDLKTGLSGV